MATTNPFEKAVTKAKGVKAKVVKLKTKTKPKAKKAVKKIATKVINKKKVGAKKVVAKKKAPRGNGGVPAKDTACGKIWALCDTAHKTKQGAVRGVIIERAVKAGLNPTTAATQFARWREHNGLVGR